MNKVAFIEREQSRSYSLDRNIRLGMAELKPLGLSEQWFLRYGGDAHWQLIAEACGQERAVFKDIYGRDVYAAFCATKIEFEPDQDLLALDVRIKSNIYHVGSYQIGSIHQILLEGECIASLYMISSFVSHEGGKSNQRIVRNKHMPSLNLENAPEKLRQIAEYSRMVARNHSSLNNLGEFIWEVKPCPSLDFNAVGLLYFPIFSKMSEMADWEFAGWQAPIRTRSIVYLGNLDIGQKMVFFKSANVTSIKRCDGKFIAHVVTETNN